MNSGDSLGIAHKKALVVINGIVQKQSVIFSFDDAFWVLGVFAVFMFLAALLLKTIKSKNKETVLILE